MVWLRPIEQPAGAVATPQPAAGVTRTEPTLDDGTAAHVTLAPPQDPVAAITARRAQEHKRALDVLSASQSMVPSASLEKGRQSPVAERAGVLLKHMKRKGSFVASTPPAITKSESPK